jgi:hypothetical protein
MKMKQISKLEEELFRLQAEGFFPEVVKYIKDLENEACSMYTMNGYPCEHAESAEKKLNPNKAILKGE